YIGKFEQLKAHFQIVTNRIGLGSLALPHVFRTAKEAFQKYYSKRTQAVVNRAYQEDIDRFGYTFE
ncbi:MAG: hypothetical protein KDD62_11485, partial [Bdellovibrionales bacterium]|nr:hypothetical protein [Bdellovibrionales bacterium]